MKNTYIIGLAAIVIIVLVVMFGTKTEQQPIEETHEDAPTAVYEIYPGDVADKITAGEDIILLDVRTPEEYAEIHLENSLLLPVDEISQAALNRIGLGESTKDKEIILYCRSGNRSQRAYDMMTALGYTNLSSVQGGMVHWQEDNYPHTETGAYEGVDYTTEQPVAMSGAQISFDTDTYDFGQIEKLGGTVTTDFTFTNTGTEDLVLGDITTSCSCTSATVSATTIAPNEKGIVTVVFDPNFHEEPQGKFTRTVFIPTNDANMPEAEVSVSVEII